MERGSAACSQVLSHDSGLPSVLQKLVDGIGIMLSLKLSDVREERLARSDTACHPCFDVLWGGLWWSAPHLVGGGVHGAADGSCFHTDR